MTDEELQQLLSGAFDAQARAMIGDHATPPPPRFAQPESTLPVPVRRRPARLLAPIAAAAAVVLAVTVGALALRGGDDHPVAADRHGTVAVGGPSGAAASTAAPGAAPVHVKLLNSDGQTYGVGMPIIAYFSRRITDARSFQAATTVTVDGRPLQAAWYFEPSSADRKFPIEAHLRPHGYWPAHSDVHVEIASSGLTAGAGLGFDDSLSLRFSTGARDVALVDDKTHLLTLTVDGRVTEKYPVSLGSEATPTRSGIKVIMSRGEAVTMTGPGYRKVGVKYTQRLTYDGEFLHAAPWNVKNIAAHIDSSNGCTNLDPNAAKALYATLRVGDVVTYPNATGPAMTLGDGYGDWNVSWGDWLQGGLVRTR